MSFVLNKNIEAILLRSSLEDMFILIGKTIEEDDPIKMDFISLNRQENKWEQNSNKNLNINLKMKLSYFDNDSKEISYAGLIEKDKILAIFYDNELIFFDVTNGLIKSRKSYYLNSENDDYFIKSTNLTNGQQHMFYQIDEKNGFIAVNKFKQIVHFSFSESKGIHEQILTTIKKKSFERIGLLKNILFCESNNELSVYNLKFLSENDVFNDLIFEHVFSQNKLQFACISSDCEYLATFEEGKVLSVFRLKNGNRRIAHIPIYNEINSIVMSNYYIVMGMKDKRILSYLLVDHLKPEHMNRISELESRYIL